MIDYKITYEASVASVIYVKEGRNDSGPVICFRGLDGELFYSIQVDKKEQKRYKEKEGKTICIYHYTVEVTNPVCRRLTWDDYRRKRCTDKEVGGILKDSSGQPQKFMCFSLYASSRDSLHIRILKEFESAELVSNI